LDPFAFKTILAFIKPEIKPFWSLEYKFFSKKKTLNSLENSCTLPFSYNYQIKVYKKLEFSHKQNEFLCRQNEFLHEQKETIFFYHHCSTVEIQFAGIFWFNNFLKTSYLISYNLVCNSYSISNKIAYPYFEVVLFYFFSMPNPPEKWRIPNFSFVIGLWSSFPLLVKKHHY